MSIISHDQYQNSSRDLDRHCRHWFENNEPDIRSFLNHIGFIASAPPSFADNSHISLASMFGAFHHSTASSSLRIRGVSSQHRNTLIDQIRLILIEHFAVCFSLLI